METSIVKISYTGKTKDGRVFDTSDESTAKENGIYDEKMRYGDLPVVAGSGNLLKGIENIIGEMKAGETRTLEIPPEDAYGERDPKLVRLVPMKLFKKQKINPYPGMVVDLDGRQARVLSVSSGRVQVDFNAEMAGKSVIYDVTLAGRAETDDEKISYLIEKNFGSPGDLDFEIIEQGADDKKERIVKFSVPRQTYTERNYMVKKPSLVIELSKYAGFKKSIFEEEWEFDL